PSTPRTYSITVSGSASGRTHTASFTSHVGDFSISTTSPSGTTGSSLTSTVTLTSTFNFAGTVSFTDSVPVGLTCQAFNPTSLSLTANGTGSTTLSCSSNSSGSFSVSITGTSGSLTHSTTATFTF